MAKCLVSRALTTFAPRPSAVPNAARFRLRSLFATVFVAWFTGALFGVMSPTFLTWAAVVSSTVQLSSVWRPAVAAQAAGRGVA